MHKTDMGDAIGTLALILAGAFWLLVLALMAR